MAFLDRTLPLAGYFVEGRIQREDRLPVPPDALREVLLNAVMHRDYSHPGGHVAVAVFDDRIEISSLGTLPTGITAEMLSGPHLSVLRNRLIAETFHRTGAVEAWGRGTNRVIQECQRWDVEPPTFEERCGAVVVTFRALIGRACQGQSVCSHSCSSQKLRARASSRFGVRWLDAAFVLRQLCMGHDGCWSRRTTPSWCTNCGSGGCRSNLSYRFQ